MGKLATAIIGGMVGALLAAGVLFYGLNDGKAWLLAEDRDRIGQLERQVEELANKPAPAPVVEQAALPDDVGARLGRLESMMLSVTERAESSEKSQAMLLSIGLLRQAVDRGDDFTVEAAAVKHLLPGEDLAGLGDGAPIPRRDQLAERFPLLAQQLLDQENEARGHGFWRIVAAHVQKVIRIRRMDGMGNDAEAVLGRAEAALAKNDWEKLDTEMRGLPGPYLAAAEPWLTQLEARLAADRALSRLTAQAVTRK